MAVTYQHPDYVRMLPAWERVRCALGGEGAVKARKLYLPQLERQTGDGYNAHKAQARGITW